jgi:hypothetical protein
MFEDSGESLRIDERAISLDRDRQCGDDHARLSLQPGSGGYLRGDVHDAVI